MVLVQENPLPHSLVCSTDIDVLPLDREVARRDGYWVIRSPSNPGHYWGNFVIFDEAPRPGDRARWESVFDAELGAADPLIRHRAFGWDRVDGEAGAVSEFIAEGYRPEASVGLTAAPEEIARATARDGEFEVVVLDAASAEWDGVIDLQLDQNRHDDDPHPADAHERFVRARVADLRRLIGAGRGAWFVARDGPLVIGSLGVIVTGGRARYQAVDTRTSHRRRGVATRLVTEAAAWTTAHHDVRQFVIVADPDYHAVDLYEKLGFRRAERVTGVWSAPGQRRGSS
jgi:GNAT superfamily N-acetyltransferase